MNGYSQHSRSFQDLAKEGAFRLHLGGGGGELTFNFQNVGKGMEKSLLLRPTLRLTLVVVVQRPIILRYQSYLEVNHRAGKNGAPSVAGSIK